MHLSKKGRRQKAETLSLKNFRFGGRGGSDTLKSLPNLRKPAGGSRCYVNCVIEGFTFSDVGLLTVKVRYKGVFLAFLS